MSTSSSSTTAKHRIEDMEDRIKTLSKFLTTVSASERPHLQSKLLSAKLMKERLIAMTAFAKAQSYIAEMEVMIAENDLNLEIERLEQRSKNDTETKPSKSTAIRASSKTKTSHIPNEAANRHASLSYDTVLPLTSSSKVPSTCSKETQTQHGHKRRHTDSFKATNKKQKVINQSEPTVASRAYTSQNTSHTLTAAMNQVNNTQMSCTAWFVNEKTQSAPKEPYVANLNRLQKVTDRLIDDDEYTLVVDTASVANSHKDAINVSNAYQKIMSPDVPQTQMVTEKPMLDDLLQSPVSSSIQVLFEDEPRKAKKKSHRHKVKAEQQTDTLNTSTDTLINGLFQDIMAAKLKHPSSTESSCASHLPEITCDVMSRRILEKY